MKMEMKMASCYGDNEKCSSCEESIWDCKCHEKKPPEKSNAESLQVFRIYRVHITKGPPVADNKRKEFVSSVIETKTLIFEGNDIDSFKWTLNSHKMSDVWESGEVKYLCAALINGEEFDAGFLLSTLGFSTCGFDESHILRTDQQNALVKFWENF